MSLVSDRSCPKTDGLRPHICITLAKIANFSKPTSVSAAVQRVTLEFYNAERAQEIIRNREV